MTDLINPPPHINADYWRAGDPAELACGDLWSFSWDNEFLGLGVIATVAPTFVLVWPISLPEDEWFAPAVVLPPGQLGTVAAWPTRETGVGRHLLHRRYGTALTPRTMRLVAEGLDESTLEDLPLEIAAQAVDAEMADFESERMVDRWTSMCFIEWPDDRVGSAPFNPEVLQALDVNIRELMRLLSTDVPSATSYFWGELIPTSSQVAAVANQVETEPSALISPLWDDLLDAQLSASIKDSLLRIAAVRGIAEGEARNLLRSQVSLAARSAAPAHERVAAALLQLGG